MPKPDKIPPVDLPDEVERIEPKPQDGGIAPPPGPPPPPPPPSPPDVGDG